MRNIAEMTERLSDLFTILDDVQSVQICPNHSKQEKKKHLHLAQSLAFAIEQVQWALGLREYTVVDFFNEP